MSSPFDFGETKNRRSDYIEACHYYQPARFVYQSVYVLDVGVVILQLFCHFLAGTFFNITFGVNQDPSAPENF